MTLKLFNEGGKRSFKIHLSEFRHINQDIVMNKTENLESNIRLIPTIYRILQFSFNLNYMGCTKLLMFTLHWQMKSK